MAGLLTLTGTLVCCLCLKIQVEWISRIERFGLLGKPCHTNGSLQGVILVPRINRMMVVCVQRFSRKQLKCLRPDKTIMKADTKLTQKVYSAILPLDSSLAAFYGSSGGCPRPLYWASASSRNSRYRLNTTNYVVKNEKKMHIYWQSFV